MLVERFDSDRPRSASCRIGIVFLSPIAERGGSIQSLAPIQQGKRSRPDSDRATNSHHPVPVVRTGWRRPAYSTAPIRPGTARPQATPTRSVENAPSPLARAATPAPVAVRTTVMSVEIDLGIITIGIEQGLGRVVVRADGERHRVSRIPTSGMRYQRRVQLVHVSIVP